MKSKLSIILLVEDEHEVQFELKKFLQRYADEVITANNGEEGLNLFKEYHPDVVISDIKMPKMNGIDMAKKIKKCSPSQIIIFTTAHSDNSFFLEAIEMQVDGYILKPVDLSLLKNKINTITKNLEFQKEKSIYANILDDIAQMQNNMLAVYDKNSLPIFYNRKLLIFLGYTTLEDFLDKHKSLSNRFEKNEECFYLKDKNVIAWIDEIKNIDSDKRIVSLRGESQEESNFFLVSLSDKTHNENTIVSFSEVTSIVNKQKQYKHDAYTDELTQIDNRAKFNIISNQEIKLSKENKNSLSMVLLDIDNFKKVNDNHGHAVGDRVLKQFTSLILDNIRLKDEFSRWGGEEFILLLIDTPLDKAKELSEHLRRIIEEYDFGIDEKLTCSFGVTKRYEGDTSDKLFKRADIALYKAKKSGRNKVIIESK